MAAFAREPFASVVDASVALLRYRSAMTPNTAQRDAEAGDRSPVRARSAPPDHDARKRRADDDERDEQAERASR